jgi:hypothetical protein
MTQDAIKNNSFAMFDTSLMDYFYNPEFEQNEKVIDAWYTYVIKFLPLVNKKWRDATLPDKLKNKQSMFHSITISDEAIMQWFIKLWVPIITDRNANNAKEQDDSTSRQSVDKNVASKNDSKGNKRGPHDTKANIKIYTSLHNEITKARRDYSAAVRWNLIFWNEVMSRNINALQNNSLSSKQSKYSNNDSEAPFPDMNENQEFLALYNVSSGPNINLNSTYNEGNDENRDKMIIDATDTTDIDKSNKAVVSV